MILKPNGKVIKEYEEVDQTTTDYLERFWKLPKKEEVEKEREKLHIIDKAWSLDKTTLNQVLCTIFPEASINYGE